MIFLQAYLIDGMLLSGKIQAYKTFNVLQPMSDALMSRCAQFSKLFHLIFMMYTDPICLFTGCSRRIMLPNCESHTSKEVIGGFASAGTFRIPEPVSISEEEIKSRKIAFHLNP